MIRFGGDIREITYSSLTKTVQNLAGTHFVLAPCFENDFSAQPFLPINQGHRWVQFMKKGQNIAYQNINFTNC